MSEVNKVIIAGGIVCGLVAVVMAGYPSYAVYTAEMSGRAEMARAEQNRQIIVRQAQAKFDASKLEAMSEVERAKGVAESNKIVADGLGGPDGYLRYLYIQQLGNADKNERTVIYVPTEGLLPVTEAGRAISKK